MPEQIWKRCIGGSQRDGRSWILNTPDGGYIIAGYGNSTDGDFAGTVNHGSDDIQLVKVDACGNIQWTKQHGGNRSEDVRGVALAPDGGFLITGVTGSTDIPGGSGFVDGMVCKVDRNGNLQWIRAFGEISVLENFGNAIFLADSSCIIVGTDDDGTAAGEIQGWLVKLDKNGNLVWEKLIGALTSDNLIGLSPTPDGNFIGCGFSHLDNEEDYWIVKFDPDGNVIWEKVYGGSDHDIAFAIKPVPSGGYILSGHTSSPDMPGYKGNTDCLVARIDESGNLLWQKAIGGTQPEMVYNFNVLPNNTFVFAAGSRSSDGDVALPNHGGFDAFTFALDDNGNLLWRQTFGGSLLEQFSGVAIDPDNSLMFAGYSNSNDGDFTCNHGQSDIFLMKLRQIPISSFDSSSCGPIHFQNLFITKDTLWTTTLQDQCGLDSVIVEYNFEVTDDPWVQTIDDTIISPGQSIILTTQSTGSVAWTGAGLSCYSCMNPIAQPSITTTYIVKTGDGDCEAIDTVKVTVMPKDTLFIPSGFTPNNDGLNELFTAIGSVSEFNMQIFNRWGNKVFESHSIQNGWDGTFQGKRQGSGVFVYMVRYRTSTGVQKILKGTVTLIR